MNNMNTLLFPIFSSNIIYMCATSAIQSETFSHPPWRSIYVKGNIFGAFWNCLQYMSPYSHNIPARRRSFRGSKQKKRFWTRKKILFMFQVSIPKKHKKVNIRKRFKGNSDINTIDQEVLFKFYVFLQNTSTEKIYVNYSSPPYNMLVFDTK